MSTVQNSNICLERGADLHMAQLMLLPLTVSCFSKIQIGFTFLVLAYPGSPGQRAIKRVCEKYSGTAVRHTAMGNHMPYGITQCYLPPYRGDIPAFSPAETSTQFSDAWGMQGWVNLVGWLYTEMVYQPEDGHPSK